MDNSQTERIIERIRNLNQEPWHMKRYIASLAWLTPIVDATTRILDLGGANPFSTALRHEGFNVSQTIGDLRDGWEFNDSSFDLITCMEVLEHVRDRNDDPDIATYTASGIQHVFSEAKRVIADGGRMFVTTPNACGFRNLLNIFREVHPFFYQPHHRELCAIDVKAAAKQFSFRVNSEAQLTVWNNHGLRKRQIEKLTRFCRRMGVNANRGDVLFFLFESE